MVDASQGKREHYMYLHEHDQQVHTPALHAGDYTDLVCLR